MFKQYINGKTVDGQGCEIQVINPATEEIAGVLNGASGEQAVEAIKSADEAFKSWSALSLNQRKLWITKLADSLENEKEKILDLLIAETGKPIDNALYDFNMLVECLRYFPEEAKRLCGSVIPDYDNSFRNIIIRQPLGVVAGYLAWNFPLLNIGYKLGPVLASGCTCILKPSGKTPLATLYIGEVAERIGFPGGVFNILAGSTGEIAGVINKSNIIKMITLIGSSNSGRGIIKESSNSIKRYSLELGGNAPAIVMHDADVEEAARSLTGLKFTNAGQVCVSPNRVFVHEKVYDRFLFAVKKYAQRIKLGSGREDRAQMGPVISNESMQRILKLIEEAVDAGARLIYGGHRPDGMPKGFYLLPTILDGVTKDMGVYKDEIFGPVMPLIKFTDMDDIIKEANNTEYGLASYLFTTDIANAFRISEGLQYGTVCVNEPLYACNLPHGGIKESGTGKDCSVYSLEEYYYIKRISIKI